MKPFFAGFVLGIALTATTGWYFAFGRKTQPVQRAQTSVGEALHHAVDAMDSKLDAFELRGKDIKEDLAHTGKVVRQKTRSIGAVIHDATSDARITTTIKGKLLTDRELSAWKIDVSTTDGLVTLSGTVSTYDQIGRAILIAYEPSGVRQVSSTLQVKQ